MGTGLTITVGGNDITAYVDARTIRIEEVGTERVATCSFEVEDDSGTVAIAAKDAVDIRPAGGGASTVLFAGEVSDFRRRRRGITSHWNVQCHDNNILLDERVLEYEYDASGQADSTIIDDLFSTYRSDIDSTTYVDTIDASMEAIRFEDMTLRDCMDAICQRTGGRYYVDYSKALHYFDAESGVNAAFGLSTSPDESTTYRLGEFEELQDGTQLLTHLRIIGEDISGWWPSGGSAPDWSSDERHGISYARDVTTQADLEAHGAEVLAAYQNPRVSYSCVCWQDGLRAGQYIPIEHEGLAIDASYYIRSLQVEFLSTDGDSRQYRLELNTESPDPVRAQHQQFQDRAAIGEVEMAVGHRGWIHDLVFSATDNETVAWTSGTITLADGKTSYSIDAGSVGSIAAVTYIYLDVDTSLTVLQTTTDDTAAIGVNKVMICVCQNVADASKYAVFQVFGGKGLGGTFVATDNMAANSITANEVGANTIITAEANIDTAVIVDAHVANLSGTKIIAATVTADKLTIGNSPFSPDNGLLLLGQPMKLERAVGGTTNYWRSTRGQRAQIGASNATPGSRGAILPVQGKWKDSLALRLDPAMNNECPNPSFETNLTGWSSSWGDTVTQSSTHSRFGTYSMKIVGDGVTAGQGAWIDVTGLTADETYTVSMYFFVPYGAVGSPALVTYDGAGWGSPLSTSSTVTERGRWVRRSVTVAPTTTTIRVIAYISGADNADTFYVDGVQVEHCAAPTSYIDGSLGDGYAWSGTEHLSVSGRTAARLDVEASIDIVESNATVSIATWAQMPYDADGDWIQQGNFLWDYAKTGDNNNRVGIYYDTSADVWYVYINGAVRLTSSSQSFSAGDHLLVVVTLDFTSDEYNLYINSALEDSDTTSLSAPAGLTNWRVGANYAAGQISGFAISEYAVFDDILTAVEVAELYEMDRPLIDLAASETPSILLTSPTGDRIEITAYEIAVYQSNDKCVEVDDDGIAILVSDAYEDIRSYQFVDGSGAVISQLKALKNTTGSDHYISVIANEITGYDSYAVIEADSPTGEIAEAELLAAHGGTYAVVLSYVSTGESAEIWHVISGTVHTVTDSTGFRVYTKIYGNNDLVFETGGSGTYSIRPDFGSGSGYLGDSTYYWNVINYKTLTDRGCLADFGPLLRMKDGSEKTPLQALNAIKTGIKASAHGNAPMFDYKTFPEACYVPGLDKIADKDIYDHQGRLVWKKGEPCGDEGIEMSSLVSVMLAAIRELSNEIDELRNVSPT